MAGKKKRTQGDDETPDGAGGFSSTGSDIVSGETLDELLRELEMRGADMTQVSAFLGSLGVSADLPDIEECTPLDEANDLVSQAWETSSRAKRIRLAKKALAISEDCVNAYILLATETGDDLNEAARLFALGVAAGERAIGQEAFKAYTGNFWLVFETRPYMTAREGLAICLWKMDRVEEAADHFRDMLRLNPNDNQGVRYSLLDLLQEMGDKKSAAALLKRYKNDPTAYWKYTDALLMFANEGASSRANKKLAKALQGNPHVPDYLLGRVHLPKKLPDYVGFGDVNEAVDYVNGGMSYWLSIPGALEWLRWRTGAE